jgi:hypothetical protein
MLGIQDRITKNPLKYYLFLLLLISIFFIVFFIIAFVISAKPIIYTLTNFFNTTNVSTTLNFFNSQTASNTITIYVNNSSINETISDAPISANLNFNSISTILAIFGAFGVLTYLFYSIKEGSFTDGNDKKIVYGFYGSLSIILFIIIIVLLSFVYNVFPWDKLAEILFLLLIFVFLTSIAILFNLVFKEFENNYENRMKLRQFLEGNNSPTISDKIDTYCRLIIGMEESVSLYIFLLILFLPIFGYLVGLNILSIIFLEFAIFLLFGGFSRLTRLFKDNCTIELRNQLERSRRPSKFLDKIFILYVSKGEYIEILTKESKRVRILRQLIYSIEDNEIIIFKELANLSPLSLRFKRILRFGLSFFITVLIIYPFVILHILHSTDFAIWLSVVGNSAIFGFCLIGWFSTEIDNCVDKIYYNYLVYSVKI